MKNFQSTHIYILKPVIFLLSASIVASPSYGQGLDINHWLTPPNLDDWDITIGAGASFEPVSPGVSTGDVDVLPYVNITYRDRYFLTTERGLGFYILRSQDDPEYGLGVALGFDEGRDESDAATELEGLGDIDESVEAIVFLEGELGPLELELELAQGLNEGGHDGFRGEVYAGIDGKVTDNLFLSFGSFLTFGDDQYIGSYYGVTSEQAARSSTFQRFDAGAGLESVGAELKGRYQITENWSVVGLVEFTHLLEDAQASPFVTDEGFFSGGVAVTYKFK